MIVANGGTMLIGLMIPLVKQQCKLKEEAMEENKQTMFTVDDDLLNGCIDINQSSAEPLSVRESDKPNTISKEGWRDEE